MKQIPVFYNNKIVAYATVDDDDFERVSSRKWVLNSNGYVRTYTGERCLYLHRFIMNAPQGDEIDHANRNKLDCRKQNLRFCTRSQNNANKACKAKYAGVRWEEDRGKFLVRISINGRMKNLGRFRDEVEAARVYNEAAKKQFGEFANLNNV